MSMLGGFSIREMPERPMGDFLRALANEVLRIRNDPALWARVEERMKEREGKVNGGQEQTKPLPAAAGRDHGSAR